MKTLLFFTLITLASITLSGCPGPSPRPLAGNPDLIVKEFVLGAPTVNANNNVEVPAHLVVKNIGDISADKFKNSVEYTGPNGSFVVAFTETGTSNIWYPRTTLPLAPNSEIAFNGKLTFHESLHGITVTIKALADSCSGDEFMPDYCRVSESDESNNVSNPVTLSLP